LSYSDLAVRGGWPAIPADAKFALGVQGANDDLLRKRLILSGDLASDRASGAFDQDLADAVKRFQARHGLAPTGMMTPRTLAAQITGVVLNPTWTVPSSIAKTEISAHMRKDPTYLSRMHMEVLDGHDNPIDPHSVDWSGTHTPNFTVRQQNGTFNALGAVKIDMPNSYSVYMHDTNQRNLFSDDYRFDSHGCSRVDNVRDLAAWLLK